MSRTELADAFVARAGWGDATRRMLAGDASNRRYERLTGPQGTAVLMDAPAEKGEDVRPFLAIARHLSALGLSAPNVLAEDVAHGFLLLEDLGDGLFARVLEREPGLENSLYSAAIGVLTELHRHPVPGALTSYDPATMGTLAALAVEWYRPGTGADAMSGGELAQVMAGLIDRHAPETDVLIQRDYHAENLLWLPGREGVRRVGLLDFQDARAGHRSYDLISLLEDARRDVSAEVREAMMARYIDLNGLEESRFHAAAAVVAAQRNLRIVGVFARLCIRDGKRHYPDMIPRVWAHLQRDLSHPALVPLRDMVERILPEPTPERIERIKDRCGRTL